MDRHLPPAGFEKELLLSAGGALFVDAADCGVLSFTDLELGARKRIAEISFASGEIVLVPEKQK